MVSQFSLPLDHFDDLIPRVVKRVIGIGDQVAEKTDDPLLAKQYP